MKKIVTMGEIMLRLSTPNNEKFIQADEFDINYGGGEANVAVSCANYGHKACLIYTHHRAHDTTQDRVSRRHVKKKMGRPSITLTTAVLQ